MWCKAKSKVYSWRLDPELKHQLEAAAGAEKTSVSRLLERLAKSWLKHKVDPESADEQERLRQLAMSFAGIFEGDGTSATNKRVRKVMDARLEAKYGKPRFLPCKP